MTKFPKPLTGTTNYYGLIRPYSTVSVIWPRRVCVSAIATCTVPLRELEKEWAEKSPEGFELRDNLLHAFRYAFRKENDLLSNVAIIAEGASRDDMIQDLNDLAVLGKANTALLEAISFDVTLLDTAAQMSEELSELLAGAKSEQAHSSETFDLRNRAYTYLKMAVDEIRDCGKYVFRNDEDRLKGYTSEYMRKLNRKRKKTGYSGEAA